jgi:hypothetical protein
VVSPGLGRDPGPGLFFIDNDSKQENEMADGTQETEVVRLARSGISSAMGKCTQPIKTNVPECVEDKLKAIAADAGCTVAEIVRDMICLQTHGATFGELSASLRRSVLQCEGRELSQLRVVSTSGDAGHKAAA